MTRASNVPTKLAAARLIASRHWPYASHALLSMVPIERRGLGTIAVDQFWRCYYDPTFIESMEVHDLAAICMHEVAHLLLKHHKRGRVYIAETDEAGWYRWNVCTDYVVNYMVEQSHVHMPEGSMRASDDGWPEGLAAEQYLKLDRERERERQEQERSEQSADSEADPQANGADPDEHSDGGGSGQGTDGQGGEGDGSSGENSQDGTATDAGGSGEKCGGSEGTGADGELHDGQSGGSADWQGEPLKPGTSGSCCDGRQRPWELPPPTDDSETAGDSSLDADKIPGLQEWEQEVITRNVAERIQKQMGRGAGGWQAVVDEILEPKLDPRRLLMKAVSRAMGAITSGTGRYSYRRPARRPSHGGMLRPRSFQPMPRITVVIDTSGSMGRDELALGVGLVSKVLSGLRLRDGVHVITGDVGAAWAGQVFDPSKIELRGGGGTAMDAIIVECVKCKQSERPELIVVVTDGYTGWPAQDVGVPVVACMTGAGHMTVPAWIEAIDIY